MRKFIFLFILWLSIGLSTAQSQPLFEHLKNLDGRSFQGRMSFPSDPGHPMNKTMTISIKKVSDNQICIPLSVGRDKSRTWVLSKLPQGIQLKHDHRHSDGTPDEVTNYGGIDQHQSLGHQLNFPADEETKVLIPAAATNVWSLRLSPDKKTLFYYLERDNRSRFEARFEL